MNGAILCRMEEYNMTLHEYIEDMRGKRIAIIGIGVSNTPLLKLLLAEGIRVTACDKRSREQMGEQAEHLEQLGCELHLGPDYLKDLEADVIFRTPGLRPDVPEAFRAIEWIAYASNAFNTMVPFYANVDTTPEYLANTTGTVSTENFYWVSRMIAAMADASYAKSLIHVERYEEGVLSASRALLNQYDRKISAAEEGQRAALREEANTAIAAELKKRAADTLDKVLFELSSGMKNAYARSDA